MEAKPEAKEGQKPSEPKRLADETRPNGKNGAADTDAIGRLDRAIQALGAQQMEIVKALNALSARMPEPTVSDPLVELVRAVQARPEDPKAYNALGHRLMVLKQFDKAEQAFRMAVKLAPHLPVGHSNLAISLHKQNRSEEAIQAFKDAVAAEPLCPARKQLTDLFLELKRFDEAIAFWEAEIKAAPHDAAAARNLTGAYLRADRLQEASVAARRAAEVGWSTKLWPEIRETDPVNARATTLALKAPKLRHDIEQLEYLVSQGIKAKELPPMIEGLKKSLARIAPRGDVAFSPLDQEERFEIGAHYNRIVHMAEAPRVAKALSYNWDMPKIEEEYISKPPGIIHFDDLLSPEALAGLRKFCIESTVWLSTNHDNGYLGAYLTDGFCPPLLVQIAEELRAAMPRVIGQHRIVGMWAYKYDQTMTGINTHADMAAVNVNFWITPDDANLDPTSGGLIVHDVEAPLEWDFDLYNGNATGAPEKIQEFLKTSKAREVVVPYKQNRAVIFNSDLFHQTAPLHFKPGYPNRRVNVTLLYGDRTDGRLDKRQQIE